MIDRSTTVHSKGGEGCEIIATLTVVQNEILVTHEGTFLDKILIRELSNGLPISGRIRITADRIE